MEFNVEVQNKIAGAVEAEVVKRIVDSLVGQIMTLNAERINHFIGAEIEKYNLKIKAEMPL